MRTGHPLVLPPPDPPPEEPTPPVAAPPLTERKPDEVLTGWAVPPDTPIAQRRQEGRWYTTPSVADQELTHPESVRKGVFTTLTLWLSNEEDSKIFSQLLTEVMIVDGERVVVQVPVLERQFVPERSTWVVLASYRPVYYQALFST